MEVIVQRTELEVKDNVHMQRRRRPWGPGGPCLECGGLNAPRAARETEGAGRRCLSSKQSRHLQILSLPELCFLHFSSWRQERERKTVAFEKKRELENSGTNRSRLVSREMIRGMAAKEPNVVDSGSELLKMLGPRPDFEAVGAARQSLLSIELRVSEQLNELALAAAPEGMNIVRWRILQAEKENELKDAAQREKLPYKSLIQLEDLHERYEKMVNRAELALDQNSDLPAVGFPQPGEELDLDIAMDMQEAYEKHSHDLDLSGRALTRLPESFAKLWSLVSLNISKNRLELLHDSISSLTNLVTLDVHSNQLKALPDSIGLLRNLKFLDVSDNLLRTLPESIGRCSNLVELLVNLNRLEYWPSSLGLELINLEKLCLQLNKLRVLPLSIGELGALKVLEIQFNKLQSLPSTIGNLSSLETLNVSSNFNDLVSVPDSIGDLASLTDFDLSFNQVRELPLSIGKLRNLKRLKLDQNPLLVPPKEVVEHSHEAVMAYLAHRWTDSLLTEEERSPACHSVKVDCIGCEYPGGWVPVRGGLWLNSLFGRMCMGGNTRLMAWKEDQENDSYIELHH